MSSPQRFLSCTAPSQCPFPEVGISLCQCLCVLVSVCHAVASSAWTSDKVTYLVLISAFSTILPWPKITLGLIFLVTKLKNRLPNSSWKAVPLSFQPLSYRSPAPRTWNFKHLQLCNITPQPTANLPSANSIFNHFLP